MIFTLSTRRAIFAAIVLFPFAVHAQTFTEDPQHPNVMGSGTLYQSVFSDYKSYQDPDIQAWKKSNAEVGKSDAMKASGMAGMKGMSDKNMDDMTATSSAPEGKKTASPSHQMPSSMPAHDGMQSR
ncbi:hypothetical protein ACVBEF_11190 [Glaciimonas sp. GG7]